MSEVWALPGYEVQALLGSGSTGQVWRARQLSTGETVALKRLRPDVDPAAVDALRREVSVLRRLDTPYVVRLRAVIGSGADAVLVLDHAAGGSLAALLARRGSLDPGEVVTIGGPLAQALAAAHARGLVHGDVTPANVLFTADGMPLLCGLGVARAAAGRAAADDVWALAALCQQLLAPDAPRALVEAIEAGLVADPAARPDAAALACLLRRAHAAAPVRLTHAPRPSRPTHAFRSARSEPVPRGQRRVAQGVLPGAALAVLLLVAGTLGWLSGRSGADAAAALPAAAPAAPSATPPAQAGPQWDQVLDELDAARAEAFSRGDVAMLAEVYAPGSAGLASDSALLQGLVDQGRTAHGLRHAVRSVEVLESSPTAARLGVVDVLGAYEIHDPAGAVVGRAAARGRRAFLVELTRTASGWRLVEVRAAG